MFQKLIQSIDIGHIILIFVSIISAAYNIYQSRRIRKNQIKDRLYEKRHAVYSKFVQKFDEILQVNRPSLDKLFKTPDKSYERLVTSTNPKDTLEAFSEFNEHLIKIMNNALEPVLILKNEINALYLDCSDEMVVLLEKFKSVTEKIHSETSNLLKFESTTNVAEIKSRWDNIAKLRSYSEMEEITKTIMHQMRSEMQLK